MRHRIPYELPKPHASVWKLSEGPSEHPLSLADSLHLLIPGGLVLVEVLEDPVAGLVQLALVLAKGLQVRLHSGVVLLGLDLVCLGRCLQLSLIHNRLVLGGHTLIGVIQEILILSLCILLPLDSLLLHLLGLLDELGDQTQGTAGVLVLGILLELTGGLGVRVGTGVVVGAVDTGDRLLQQAIELLEPILSLLEDHHRPVSLSQGLLVVRVLLHPVLPSLLKLNEGLMDLLLKGLDLLLQLGDAAGQVVDLSLQVGLLVLLVLGLHVVLLKLILAERLLVHFINLLLLHLG
mmetsp:Transcript_15725/g.35800  ORF Transcript_15725/g.35800 Transcript_15725/m.35800 type:complete len:292 (-) Transcript_15725:1012-1887(-)